MARTADKKTSKGGRRIEIKRVEDKNKRHVTFSKRKTGIFNKAAQLNVLTGAEVAGIIVSSNSKVFCFGSPAPDAIINRYLADNNASLFPVDQPDHPTNASNVSIMHGSNKQVEEYMEARTRIEAEKIKRGNNNNNNIDGETGGFWWEKPIETMTNLEELEEYMEALHKLKHNAEVRTNEMIRNI
ncbi:hypothetical protein TB2_024184 [Malus domestica]